MSPRHCTPDELLDVADGTLTAEAVPHLSACAACQREVEQLRGALTDVSAVPVPEPPAEFWTQLSARVHDAVAQEPAPRATRRFGWPAWNRIRTVWPAAVTMAVAVLLAVVLIPRERTRSTMPAGGAVEVAPPMAENGGAPAATELPGIPAEEEAAFLAFMGDLADGLDADAAASEGLWPTVAATDAAVGDLSGEERVELQRLLQEAMSSGAGV